MIYMVVRFVRLSDSVLDTVSDMLMGVWLGGLMAGPLD